MGIAYSPRLIIGILALAAVLILVATSIFQLEITLGEIIGISLFLAAAALGWSTRRFLIGRPFRMKYSLDPYEFKPVMQERRQDTKLTILIGECDVLLRVMPREGMEFERIGVRCVERKVLFPKITRKDSNGRRHYLWQWRNILSQPIEVTRMYDHELEKHAKDTNRRLTDWDDDVGGRWGEYLPPYPRMVEDSLWLGVSLKAKRAWEGHISFEGNNPKTGHRGYMRRRITVRP